ncbi:MAG: acyl carrier protein [Patescibacteria group bacterium]|nr:acyl carrier protein [Patescibacteria group bacterium]
MSKNSVESRLKKVIVRYLEIDENKIVPTAKFIDDLGADSLDLVEIVMSFEEEFECEIPDEDAEKLTTVQAALDYIATKIG